jgi:hypothetical protein
MKMEVKALDNKEIVSFEQDGSNFMEQVENLERILINSGSPDIFVGNSEELPLKHLFTDGIYTREIFLKKEMFAIGKIHKHEHTYFLLKGKLRIFTENGVKEIEAPYYGNSPSGTKRVVYALEDSIFVNVHPNPDNISNIEELEEKFVVSSFEEYNKYKLLK